MQMVFLKHLVFRGKNRAGAMLRKSIISIRGDNLMTEENSRVRGRLPVS